MSERGFDFDFAIIGSGFGGSVSALRLAEKGYSVAVLEMGKRWSKDDFPRTTWDVRRYLWRPRLGLHGILQMTLVKDAFFLHGAGVGGGSLVYANTLLVPPDEAFADPRWVGQDWKAALAPHYATAKRMLGVTESQVVVETDRMLKEVADEMGRGHTWKKADVGVFFGEPGKTVPDPFFDGEGPPRTGCTLCGGCMVGCRVGAKNSLDQNYLYLAEKRGVTIQPESRVVDVTPRSGGGYELTIETSTAWIKRRRTLRARGVVVAGGSYGTVDLLMRCKDRGSLRKLSRRLGSYLRTNSEALLGVRSNEPDVDYSKGIAITSGVFVDDKTHIEVVRYPRGSDALAPLATVLTDGGGWLPRPLRWLGTIVRHPLQFLRSVIPFGWAQKTAILLVMQPVDNHLAYRLRRPWYWPFSKKLDSAPGEGEPAPTYIPVANLVARKLAEKMRGTPQSGLLEVLLGKASTAHILGGCPMGLDADDGVVDPQSRAFGYDDLYIVDGSVIPANLGVNPSLTITAMAEHAMAHVPPRAERAAGVWARS
ncbi:MAG: GMC family oxidoreductase [Labilithrix sp.]|nr:GMC family oxidoreductase [Labilithrix sp.]MCW5833840.1 GMC family oxidoreductase [Labilithrix sp.]